MIIASRKLVLVEHPELNPCSTRKFDPLREKKVERMGPSLIH
jgi:hypothetical protein